MTRRLKMKIKSNVPISFYDDKNKLNFFEEEEYGKF
jgi:hypothetical protein